MEDTKARAHAQAKVEAEELFHKQKQVNGEKGGGGDRNYDYFLLSFSLHSSIFVCHCVGI